MEVSRCSDVVEVRFVSISPLHTHTHTPTITFVPQRTTDGSCLSINRSVTNVGECIRKVVVRPPDQRGSSVPIEVNPDAPLAAADYGHETYHQHTEELSVDNIELVSTPKRGRNGSMINGTSSDDTESLYDYGKSGPSPAK